MNVYIDTNIFLTFYHLTSDDLDELKKLAILIEDKQLRLFVPTQTINEFERNREKTIADAINSLKEQKISSRYPQISKEYKGYDELKKAYKEFEKHKNSIINNIQKDASTKALNADKLTKRIFDSSEKITTTNKLIDRAKIRFDLGNPPGKGKSYGDALNWESLLESVPQEEDLNLISDDGDFISILDKKELNQFLRDEWSEKKKSKINFFKTLSEFLKVNYPKIKLSDQLEKDLAIRNLASAGSFASAKSRLSALAEYKEFSTQQLNDIIEIAITNNQIYWISSDIGVGDCLIRILDGKEDVIDPEILKEFNKKIGSKATFIEDDLPF